MEDDNDDLELWYPFFRSIEAGYEPVLIGSKVGTYQGKRGYEAKASLPADRADAHDILGLVIPGG